MLVFGEKIIVPGNYSHAKGEKQQQTQPTNGVSSWIRPLAIIVERRSSHRCTNLDFICCTRATKEMIDVYTQTLKSAAYNLVSADK